jgi:hypothetical protein
MLKSQPARYDLAEVIEQALAPGRMFRWLIG